MSRKHTDRVQAKLATVPTASGALHVYLLRPLYWALHHIQPCIAWASAVFSWHDCDHAHSNERYRIKPSSCCALRQTDTEYERL